ncbi:MAG: hypothetical protein ACR2LV_05575, partial [Solirubrobacteraceae bacterium]
MVTRTKRRRRFAGVADFMAVASLLLGSGSAAAFSTAWVPVGRLPLSDAAAALLVVHSPESRPDNSAANAYVPTDAQLSAFQSTLSQY